MRLRRNFKTHPCTHFNSLLPGCASPGGISKHIHVPTSVLCYPALRLRRNFKTHPCTHLNSLLPGFASPEEFQNTPVYQLQFFVTQRLCVCGGISKHTQVPTSFLFYPALRLRRNFKTHPYTQFISVTRLCVSGVISKNTPCTHLNSLLPGFASPEEFQNTPIYPLHFSVTRLCVSGGISKNTPCTHLNSLLPGFASPEEFKKTHRVPTSILCYPALRLRRNFRTHPCTNFSSLLTGFASPEEFQNTPSFVTGVAHATGNRKHICSPVNSAVQPHCSHTGCSNVLYKTQYTTSYHLVIAVSDCSFRLPFRTFLVHFHSSYTRKAES